MGQKKEELSKNHGAVFDLRYEGDGDPGWSTD